MSDGSIIEILTDRLFMSNEEELMHVLGWNSIINLWRVQEAIEMKDIIDCFKVVDANLQSLQLAGNKKTIQYAVGSWVLEPDPIEGPGLHGGILSYNYLSDAKWLANYVRHHPNPTLRKQARIFKAVARGMLHTRCRKRGSPYTFKTREIMLAEELLGGS